MTDYRIIYENPDEPDEPAVVIVPSDDWMQKAQEGSLTYLSGPLTEKEAIEYLIMKDIPRNVWGQDHNRPMFKIVTKDQVPSDRSFRNAWRLAA